MDSLARPFHYGWVVVISSYFVGLLTSGLLAHTRGLFLVMGFFFGLATVHLGGVALAGWIHDVYGNYNAAFMTFMILFGAALAAVLLLRFVTQDPGPCRRSVVLNLSAGLDFGT